MDLITRAQSEFWGMENGRRGRGSCLTYTWESISKEAGERKGRKLPPKDVTQAYLAEDIATYV
eukprot:scaffold3926_cov126-Skeletonema_menzelii.AAC.4